MYEKPLQSAGLTAGEAEIYEILLNLGPAPAQSILKKTALKRGNVYNILAGLEIQIDQQHFVPRQRQGYRQIHGNKSFADAAFIAEYRYRFGFHRFLNNWVVRIDEY